jgi:hypothetical protein
MAVRFCVVAGPNAAAITNVAQNCAAADPVLRTVLVPGSAGYPGNIVIAATNGFANPGAVVLKNDADTVSTVLNTAEAQNALIVNASFAQAAV